MDVLGITASIIAVIQLTGQVISLSTGYISAVKQAPEGIQRLLDEVTSLQKILLSLKELTGQIEEPPGALQMLDGTLLGCFEELTKLGSKLARSKSKRGWKKTVGALGWPLKENENLQIMARIERYKSSFMVALNTSHVSLSKDLQRDFRAGKEADGVFQEKTKRKQILEWVYPGEFDTKQIDISSKRQENTARWLFESPEFQKWFKSESKLLWGYGIPGAGKTYLCSAVVDWFHNARKPKHGIAYVYFDYHERDRQMPVHTLSCLVKQLAIQAPHLPVAVEKLYERLDSEGKRPNLKELYSVLISTFGSFDRVFLIFDALDECEQKTQRKELLPLFHRMGSDGASLFLTSRQHPEDIQESFKEVFKLQLSARAEDIRSYIQEKISKNSRAKRLVQRGKCEDKIVSELTRCADGMFLLVRFQIEYLCQQTTTRQILAALETLKGSAKQPLDLIYERILNTLSQQSQSCVNLATEVLTWLITARRILTVKELQEAVSVEANRYELDELDLPDKETIIDVCCGLVTTDENSDKIRLTHFTAQEYLLRHPIIPENAEFKLAVTCITYLSFDVFAEGACSSVTSLNARLDAHPFLAYATRNMRSHLKHCDESLSKDLILRFLALPDNISCWAQADTHLENNRSLDDWRISRFVGVKQIPLHIASFIGNCLVIQHLLDSGADVSEPHPGMDGTTAVQWAAWEGNENVVQLLIDNGADIFQQDELGGTTLHRAVAHEAVVRLLLNKGVNSSIPDNAGRTALHWAANQGQEAVVRLLLEKDADSNILKSDVHGQTPLFIAAFRGDEGIVRLLLEKGADEDVSKLDKYGRSALAIAAEKGHERVVRLLLEKGAKSVILKPDIHGQTPLSIAAFRGYEGIVQLLLENGAGSDISKRGRGGWSLLVVTAWKGYEGVVKLLLEKWVDISASDLEEQIALHNAIAKAHQFVNELLDKKANHSMSAQEKYVLSEATPGAHENVACLLKTALTENQMPNSRVAK